ncbi:uncharacterized protein [Amphiura filiformis]|uniref:uncharacterized protein n=1 Tax=Amphiura filiformis TaxID=82378 RepID=UPI003B21A391
MRKTRKRYSLLLLLTCLVCVISLWTSLRSLWITDSNPLDTRSNREILNEDISKIAADIIAAEKIFNATDIKTLETVKFHHVSRIPAAQLPWQPKNNSVANVGLLEIPPAQFPWQLKNNSVANDTMLQVTTRKPKPITRKLGIDLMRTLYRNTRKLADTSGHHSNFFSNVSSILATPWRHDTYNAKLFRFIYENVTRMNAYDDTMLTQRNKGKRIYGTINIPKESLLPKAPYKSCSVVGSSRVLLGLKCGTLIDENDFVFRSTLSSIAGPAEDVGKKTNMTTLNSSILKRFAIRTPRRYKLDYGQSK